MTNIIGARVSKDLYDRVQKLNKNNTEVVRDALELYLSFVNSGVNSLSFVERDILLPDAENVVLTLKLKKNKDTIIKDVIHKKAVDLINKKT